MSDTYTALDIDNKWSTVDAIMVKVWIPIITYSVLSLLYYKVANYD